MKKIIPLFLMSAVLFAQASHALYQWVEQWPTTHDTTGVKWVIYYLGSPEQNVSLNDPAGTFIAYSSGSPSIAWYTEVSNWYSSWSEGDELISFGSWDSAYAANPLTYGDNPEHTGFYWIYNDTLDANADPQEWATNPSGMRDTLRPMPVPIADLNLTQDSVVIKIPNPQETIGNPANTNVMGFLVFADTTNPAPLGTPNALNKEVGYFARDAGDTTFCKDWAGNYPAGRNVIFAYKIVARPDTTLILQNSPGYTSEYLSRNSNPVPIPLGKEETGLTAFSMMDGIQLKWMAGNYQNAKIIRNNLPVSETHKNEYFDKGVKVNQRYTYKVHLIYPNNEIKTLGPVNVVFKGKQGLHIDFSPNIFNGKSDVSLFIPYEQKIELKVVDVMGREIKTLYSGNLSSGAHRFTFHPVHQKSGIYHIVLKGEKTKFISKRILLVK